MTHFRNRWFIYMKCFKCAIFLKTMSLIVLFCPNLYFSQMNFLVYGNIDRGIKKCKRVNVLLYCKNIPRKFWSILLCHFIKHKPIISKVNAQIHCNSTIVSNLSIDAGFWIKSWRHQNTYKNRILHHFGSCIMEFSRNL